MEDQLGFTLYSQSERGRREHKVLSTWQPERVDVPSSYKQAHRGCPFHTALRPTSFKPGSDAYHAPPTSEGVLIEIATCDEREGVEEYIGLLARHTADTPSENGVREVKWIPRNSNRPVFAGEAARDLGPSRHTLLSDVYGAVDRWSAGPESSRELGLLTNKVLGEYLGTMCHDMTPLYDALNDGDNPEVRPASEADKAVKPLHEELVDHVKQECLQGRKAWYGAGKGEDHHR